MLRNGPTLCCNDMLLRILPFSHLFVYISLSDSFVKPHCTRIYIINVSYQIDVYINSCIFIHLELYF